MNKYKNIISIILSTVLITFVFVGCQSQGKDIDAVAVASDIVNKIEFVDELAEISQETAITLYGFDSKNIECIESYLGSGATAEEVTVVKFKKMTEADKQCFTNRIEQQKESYKTYIPEEIKKLNDAVIVYSGNSAILCVCNDSESAKKVINDLIT